jgi:integrase
VPVCSKKAVPYTGPSKFGLIVPGLPSQHPDGGEDRLLIEKRETCPKRKFGARLGPTSGLRSKPQHSSEQASPMSKTRMPCATQTSDEQGSAVAFPKTICIVVYDPEKSPETAISVWQGREAPESEPPVVGTAQLTPAQLQLRRMVLDSVTSPHSRRNYGKALDLLFAFAASRPLTRALLLEYRTSMEDLAPSTVNVRLAAVRKLVSEARKNGMLCHEDAANLTDIPNVKEKGTRLGNWLTKEQARELLAVPDRSTVKGKRDYAILALLVGCALRRRELASLTVEDIQMRENRWVIIDLLGKGGRVRTVAIPVWVKKGIDVWQAAGSIEKGPLLRSISKGGKVRESLSDWAIWAVVAESAREIGIERFGAHDLRRTCAKLCRKAGGDLEQIKFLLGHSSIQTTERYLGSEQDIAVAVNDSLGL